MVVVLLLLLLLLCPLFMLLPGWMMRLLNISELHRALRAPRISRRMTRLVLILSSKSLSTMWISFSAGTICLLVLGRGGQDDDEVATTVEATLRDATSLTGMMSSSSIEILLLLQQPLEEFPFRPLVSLTGNELKFCMPPMRQPTAVVVVVDDVVC